MGLRWQRPEKARSNASRGDPQALRSRAGISFNLGKVHKDEIHTGFEDDQRKSFLSCRGIFVRCQADLCR